MSAKITRDVLEAYLQCKTKSYLEQTNQQGIKCDYENLLLERRLEVRRLAIEKILARHAGEEIPRNIPLTTFVLKQGASFILDPTLEDDLFFLSLDGVKKVDGPSNIGAFHYIPMLYCEGEKVRTEQRLMLEVYGLLLGQVQDTQPRYGILWHGNEGKATRVGLRSDLRRPKRIIQTLTAMCSAVSPPKLILNDHCQVCEFSQRCRSQAVQEDNLSLLLGMEEKQIAAYNRKGFFTITQISHTFRYRKPRKRAKVHAYPHYYSLQARSIRTGLVHIHGTPSLPISETKVYLDIEGVPDRDFYYLIGILVESKQSVSYHSFWANNEMEQDGLFLSLIEFIGSLPSDCVIFHYGKFEMTALKKVVERIPPDNRKALQAIIEKMVNVLSVIHRHVYFPTYSNSLKEIGRSLGFHWNNPNASGIQSMVWRQAWDRTHDSAIKQELLTYNMDDCAALKKVCEFIANSGVAMSGDTDNKPGIVTTSNLPKAPSTWPFYGRPTFVLSDLERASRCAYFDYQRERVYVRTNKRFKQIKRRSNPNRIPLTPNKRVLIECHSCPACGGTNLKRRNRLKRKTIDLKFFNGGVKKWIVLYRSWTYGCNSCGIRFTSADWIKNRSLYQAGLMCWCVYQNIECRQTMWQVKDTLADVFRLHVPQRLLYLFKDCIAQRYSPMYEEIRQSILKGHLIHIDEATVDLRNEKGYVWVIASLDKVYYFFKSSREGAFLKELLDGFKGVMVSDFFSAYESVNCRQQKCLLHFLRDVNDDLQKNPFDDEFKLFAQEFATLLRNIVEAIDKHGLATSYLSRFVSDAHRFVESVSTKSYLSEVMIGYQKRIKKSGSKMFTFLEYDNVPWNNNNAEHAIKYLAKYKRTSEGLFSERSLKESLVFLSVFQTCHFNGVNVISFLLSGRTDLASILGT